MAEIYASQLPILVEIDQVRVEVSQLAVLVEMGVAPRGAANLDILTPTGYATIAAIRDIAGPGLTQSVAEVSSRTANQRAYATTMLDGGEVTFDVVFDPDNATHDATTGLLAILEARAVRLWRVQFAAVTTPLIATFRGLLTKVGPKTPILGTQTADVTIRLEQEVTWSWQ